MPISAEFTAEEIQDILVAIWEAQKELCVGEEFPESTAYNTRLESIKIHLRTLIPENTWPPEYL